MSSAVYDYIENVTALSNNRYEYKTLKNKKALGDELIKTLNRYNCDPAKALYKVTNGSNRFGFRLMKIVSEAPLRLGYESGLKVRDGIGMIGEGVYGKVYIGCIDKACKKEVAIKMASDKENRLEFNFMKKFEGVSPNITHAYYYKKCPKPIKSVLYLEYYSFGSVKRLLGKYEDKLRKLHARVILFQIIWTLSELHRKFPSFRHNDLHTDNVFVDDRVTTKGSILYGKFLVPNIGMNAVIGDFGFANMQADGFRNSKVQSGEFRRGYGIAVNNDYRYDVHFFLNDIYQSTKNQSVKNFIKRHFPLEYLKETSRVVENNRLRYGVDHSKLPTFDQLLGDKIFRFFRPRGNTVIPPVNKFPKSGNSPVSPVQTMSPKKTLKTPVSPVQTISPKKSVRKVVARPLAPNAPVVKKTFNAEAIKKHLAKPEIRAVPVAASPKSRMVKPMVSPSPQKGDKFGIIINKNVVKFTNVSSRGKKCETFKKDEVVAKAKKLGITGVEKLSKEKICGMIKNALA